MLPSRLAWAKRPLAFAAYSRALVLAVSYVGLAWVRLRDPFNPSVLPNDLLVDGSLNWDARWYARIAEHGYTNLPNAQGQRDVVFMPLFPLLTRAVGAVTGSVWTAGFLVANVCFLAAMLVLHRLVKEKHGDEPLPTLTVLLIGFCPWAFYFSSMHTESLFLLATLGAFYAAHRRAYWVAGLSLAVASATRTVGILALVGVGLVYLEQIDFDWRRIRADVLWLLLGAVGLGGYMLYLHQRFGDPWLFTSSLQVGGWGRDQTLERAWFTVRPLLFTSAWRRGAINFAEVSAVLAWVTACLVTLAAWRKLGVAYAAWTILVLLAATQMWTATPRYLLVQFPLFLLAAQALKDRRDATLAVLLASAMGLGLLTFLHSHGFWVS